MKFIIEIQDDTNPVVAVECVKQVVDGGLVSNNNTEYCYVTVFHSGVVVGTKKNKKSYRFCVRGGDA